jgi:hypothetical protein
MENKPIKHTRHLLITISATYDGTEHRDYISPHKYYEMDEDMLEMIIGNKKELIRERIAKRPMMKPIMGTLMDYATGDRSERVVSVIEEYKKQEQWYRERLAALKDLEFMVTEEWV